MGRCRKPSSSREWGQQGGGLGSNEVRGSRDCSWINLELKIAPCRFCLCSDFLKVSAAPWRKPASVCVPTSPPNWLAEQNSKNQREQKTASSSSGSLWITASPSPEPPEGPRVSSVFFLTGIIRNKVLEICKDVKIPDIHEESGQQGPLTFNLRSFLSDRGKSSTRQRWRVVNQSSPCCP